VLRLWVPIAPFAAWAVLRLSGYEGALGTVQLLAFTPYVALASLAPLVAAAITKKLWPALVASLVSLALAACVLPRFLADSDNPSSGTAVRVLSVNMMLGLADPQRIVDLVRAHQVDVLALQEYTAQARDGLTRAGLDGLLPYHVEQPDNWAAGSALYSRYPLGDEGVRVHRSGFRQAQATVGVPGAAPVQLESVHPCAPTGPAAGRCWARDLADEPAATPHGPVRILIGDFNATLDHSALRRLIGTGYRDAADTVGAGFARTWPYDERWYIPAVTIDHVLVDRRVGVTGIHTYAMKNSDHRALFATLRLPPS
jgi:endonuclease/exonuclease/phosphatase (EEP) superfamily protein YafD